MTFELQPPDSASYPLTAPQYQSLLATLKANKDAHNLRMDDANSGTVTFRDIDFAWAWNLSMLKLSIGVNRNWKARTLGNKYIFGQIDKQLIAPQQGA